MTTTPPAPLKTGPMFDAESPDDDLFPVYLDTIRALDRDTYKQAVAKVAAHNENPTPENVPDLIEELETMINEHLPAGYRFGFSETGDTIGLWEN